MSYLAFLRANFRFLAFGFALTFASSFGQTFFIALSGAGIRADFGLSHGEFGGAYLAATLMSALTLAWVGRHIDRIDLRLYTALACLGLALAAATLGLARAVALLVLALYALRLAGQGLMGHIAMTGMARYFEAERGRAVAAASLGLPLGEAVLPLAGVALIANLGWRGAWLAVAAAVALVLVPLALWLLKGHGARDAALARRLGAAGEAAARAGQAPAASGRAPARDWTRAEALGDRRFWLALPAVLAPAFVLTGFFFHQAALAAAKGWALAWLAACFLGFAGAKVASQVAAGPLVDRLGAARCLPWTLPPLALAMLALALFDHPAAALAYMTLAGLTQGAAITVGGSLWAELYGVRHLGAIRALATATVVASTALAPFALGWGLDSGVSFEAVAAGCAGYVVVAMGLGVGIGRIRASG